MESDEMGGGVKKGGVFRSCRSSSLHTPSFSTPPITTHSTSGPEGLRLTEWKVREVNVVR